LYELPILKVGPLVITKQASTNFLKERRKRRRKQDSKIKVTATAEA